MRLESGDRIARDAEVMLGACAVVFNPDRHLLLIRRSDNRQWCLPGGRHDPGETIGETCLRELQEETGLAGRIERVIGIYSSPEVVAVYRDGIRRQVVAVSCLVIPDAATTLRTGPEAIDARYFQPED